MWIYPLLWGQHIQIQIGGKRGERGNKTNKQGVRGDRTGRIFNPPNKFSEHQTVRGQEAVLIFQKGENKSTPEIELLVWPHCCASLFNPSETQHSWRHRDQEETVKPRRSLPVCAAVAWRVIHCSFPVSGCEGFPDPCAKLADMAQAYRRPTHLQKQLEDRQCQSQDLLQWSKQTPTRCLPLTRHSVLKRVRS